MVKFSVVFFLWICNKRGGFLSPCFPLDLFYCYRNFVSQNWHRKFVIHHWKMRSERRRSEILKAATSSKLRAASSTCCQQARAARTEAAARGSQHMLPARAGSLACARSTRWHRLLAQKTAWPAARTARAASSAREFGAFPVTWRRVVWRRRCVGDGWRL